MYYIEINPSEMTSVREKLTSANVVTATHYQPLHLSKYGIKLGSDGLQLKNSELVSKSLLRIPLWMGMSEKIIDQIVEAILNLNLASKKG